LPRADPKLVEDEYSTAVQRAGHGLQRAFLLTLLQHLAIAEAPAVPDDEGNEKQAVDSSGMGATAVATVEAPVTPDLILGIEEPELYQHPNRQRHLSAILLRLATGRIEGVAKRTQVIYATHSPLFVDVSRTDQIRVLRKVPGEDGQPRRTKVSLTSLAQAASIVEEADGKPPGTYSAATLEPRLVALMTPWMNEGFFARVAVLVEGEQDRAAILGGAKRRELEFESIGISVIPCSGKTNLDRPVAIFRALDIPVYAIWDSDQGGDDPRPEVNRRLLRLFRQEPENWPERVCDAFACFRESFDVTLRSEIGPQLFDELLEEARAHFQFDKKDRALKCPQAIDRILERAHAEGKSSPTLDNIISKIVALQ
jgi:predicted ATP-dependent endonuclease of OLD family